jgi:hypothetical protein
MERRYGIIRISKESVEDTPNKVAEIFSKAKAVVLSCDYEYTSNQFRYIIYSPLLRIIREEEKIPKYHLNICTSQEIEKGPSQDFLIHFAKYSKIQDQNWE